MLLNYLKIAFRNLTKFKTISFINIVGLAIGTSLFIIMTLFVVDELSYDKFNEKYDRIYRVAMIWGEGGQTRTPHPMAQALVEDFPEVEQAVSMSPVWGPGLTWAEFSVRYGDKRFIEKRFFSADTNFFDVFTFEAIAGNPSSAIREAGSIIITESIADKYFGDIDPIGKTIILDDRRPFIVKAVIKDILRNSHFHFDFLISYLSLKPFERSNYYTWADFGHFNYIVLAEGVNPQNVDSKIPEWSKRYIDYSIPDLKSDRDISKFLKLQALSDIHLKSNLRWELEANGSMTNVYIFSASALLILFIACFNFTNLSMARSIYRAKEVGIRKSIGADKKKIFFQFISESLLISFISLIGALILVETFLPYFNSYTNKDLSLSVFTGIEYIISFFSLIIFVGFVAGIYPSLFLSMFNPTQILKGKINVKGASTGKLKKGIVIFQFAISIFLFVSTAIIYNQLQYLRNKNLGFQKDQVIALPMQDKELISKTEAVKNSLLSKPGIINAAATTNLPGGQFDNETIRWKPDEDPEGIAEMWVDDDFFSTLGIEIVEGRAFSEDFPGDSSGVFMLNKAAADLFDWKTPIGEEITWYPQDREIKGRVIGVTGNFHFKSLRNNIEPLIILYGTGGFKYIVIKVAANEINTAINSIEETWNEFSAGEEFEYYFLDDYFGKTYYNDEKLETLFGIFSLLAITIASLGLFGLATFMTENKMKEIGIRKALGASVANITALLAKDFVKWILIANLFAFPAAYLVMQEWLQDFAYRADLPLLGFVLSGVLALIVALVTVSLKTIRAATANPVKSLRYE
ncbi:MAG: ABC transporter permease [Ignavibacteria bacterium]|jgi:putative ABC transport system permease protein